MTELGEYFIKKSINRADLARKTGIDTTRLHRLTNDINSNLRAKELYLIALALDTNPCDLLNEICKEVKLPTLPKEK